jgi:HlyD family secretion protein
MGKDLVKADDKRGRALAVPAQDTGHAAPAILEFQSPTATLIAQPIPRMARLTAWLVGALVASSLVVLGVLPIDQVVVARGRVVPVGSKIVVQPLETSIVRNIAVREGQLVRPGELLAQLDPTFAAADAGSLQAQVASLQAEVDRLQAEADGRTYLSDGTPDSTMQASYFNQRQMERNYKLENYRQRIDSARVKVEQAAADVATYSQQFSVAQTVESKRRELERLQVGSQLNTLAAMDARVQATRGLETARSTLEGGTRDMNAIIAERDGYLSSTKNDIAAQLTEQGRKLSDAKEQLHKASLRKQLVDLRADREAVVLSVAKVSVGSVMQSGDEFITLVPTDAALEVEGNVPGFDAGYVHVGDPVVIKFDTFDYLLHGYARGTVRMVSADSFTNPSMDRERVLKPDGNLGVQTNDLGELYFRSRISLDEVKLHNIPDSFRMTPGMPITADIKVGERSPLSFLFSRFLGRLSEGMREP